MHVAMTAIFDPSTVPDGYSFEKVKEFIQSRLHLVPPFRRRVVEVPFRLNHDLGRGPGLRPRLPHPPDRDPEPGWPPRARRPRRADRQHAARPQPSPVGAVRGGGPGRGQHRRRHQDAPLRGGRRVRRRADGQPVRLRPGGSGDRAPEPREPEPIPSDLGSSATLSPRVPASSASSPCSGPRRTVGTLVSRRRDPEASVGAVPLTAPPTPWNNAIPPPADELHPPEPRRRGATSRTTWAAP